jgi:hypothetical protein
MVAVTPVGPLALPPYLLRRMVALSPTFQAGCELTDFDKALARTFWKDAEGNEPRPCATVNHTDQSYRLIAGGGQNYLRPRGGLMLWVGQDILEEHYDDNNASMLRFSNFFGGIIEDVINLSGADQTADTLVPDSHLAITGSTSLMMSINPEEEWATIGRFWWGGVVFEWGDGD